jgi:hypothetical protein
MPIDHNIGYHYSYGRQRSYGVSSPPRIYEPFPTFHPERYFSPRKKTLARLDDGPQTVEQLIEQGYFAAPPGEPETSILYDKKHTSWLGLDDILTQARQRRDIYEKNMLEIEWAKCYAFNELARGGWPFSEEKYVIHDRRLQDLHGDQRTERVSLWRDMSRLRQQLPESAQQYLSASRKIDIIADMDGDAP